MFGEKINFEQYLDFKERVKKFIIDEQWLETLLFDSLLNKEVARELNDLLIFFSREISNEELVEKCNELREKSQKSLLIAKKQDDIEEKWNVLRIAYAYYGMIEVITEGSIFSEHLIDEFKKKYGSEYLQILQKLDKENPSSLTNFRKEENQLTKNELNEKYLILKKWQDDQNIYHNKIIYPTFSKARELFGLKYDEINGKISVSSRQKLALQKLLNCNMIKIDTIAMLVDCGMKNELASVVGGKAFGLACLKQKSLNIPKTYVVPVKRDFSESNLEVLSDEKKYAVRSSADVEDGTKNSFAGMFDSFLNIKLSNIKEKFIDVKNSIYSKRLKSYIEKFKLKTPKMAVVIQEFCNPVISGVWIGKDQNSGILEYTNGTGDNLVSGKVKPIMEEHPNKIDNGLKINGESAGQTLLKYQKMLNVPCDFEWCIDENETLFMLQFRPVTTKVKSVSLSKTEDNVNRKCFEGTAASSGYVEAPVCFLEDEDEMDNFKEGSILVTYYTDPDWVEIMTKAKGIVTAQGGLLCHTAIIARELGIPCVTGIGEENLEEIARNKIIAVDGSEGKVILKKTKENELLIEDRTL